MQYPIKEVRFDQWCSQCKHYEKSEAEDPCWDCLNQGWNYNSHKPTMFEEVDRDATQQSRKA